MTLALKTQESPTKSRMAFEGLVSEILRSPKEKHVIPSFTQERISTRDGSRLNSESNFISELDTFKHSRHKIQDPVTSYAML